MGSTAEELFTQQLRKATREVHNVSDLLVQSKLVIGLVDDRVWAEGLLVFYEIFAYLEASIQRQSNTPVGKFDHASLRRAAGFEADFESYYGADWRTTHSPTDRECVRNYLRRLEEIERTEPVLLIAYIYHLYLGLLSGGQILRKRLKLGTRSKFSERSSAVEFEEGAIPQLKKFIKDTTNEIADSLDAETKNKLLEESKTVFALNCELIRSVRSAKDAVIRMGLAILIGVFFFVTFIVLYKSSGSESDDEKEL